MAWAALGSQVLAEFATYRVCGQGEVGATMKAARCWDAQLCRVFPEAPARSCMPQRMARGDAEFLQVHDARVDAQVIARGKRHAAAHEPEEVAGAQRRQSDLVVTACVTAHAIAARDSLV